MKINLNDKVVQSLVLEYLNAIINYKSRTELDFDVHKLIHSFEVLEMAEELITLADPALSAKQKKQIRNAAMLHDIGRCHEFKDGVQLSHFDHGQAGARVVHRLFPDLTVECLCVGWHNRRPGDQDPPEAQPILNYIRDADMLGNIWYNALHMSVFLPQILPDYPKTKNAMILNREIQAAARERRSPHYEEMEKFDFLDMIVGQLLWIFNLRTKAAFRLSQQKKMFSHLRSVIIDQVLPALKGTQKEQTEAARCIQTLFPDSLFAEEAKRHGV